MNRKININVATLNNIVEDLTEVLGVATNLLRDETVSTYLTKEITRITNSIQLVTTHSIWHEAYDNAATKAKRVLEAD